MPRLDTTVFQDDKLSEADEKSIRHLISSSADAVSFSDRFVGDQKGKFIYESLSMACDQDSDNCPCVVEAKGCNQGLDSSSALASLLKKKNCKINEINLEWNQLGNFESGLMEVASSLRINTSLTKLDLRNNNIGQHGGTALARALSVNRSLR